MNYIKKICDIRLSDVALVGGKTASLGQMMGGLSDKGIVVPNGFALTAQAYDYFITYNDLQKSVQNALAQITDPEDNQTLSRVGEHIRALIQGGTWPTDLAAEIESAYADLSAQYAVSNVDVAVRSSATAEDLPGASFAGQQESYLNIVGVKALLEHCKQCFASLYTDRAIVYRIDKGFAHIPISLSVAVQKMVRADKGCAGVAFSLDTESGFKDAIVINAAYGLGEVVVQGLVTPDEYVLHKPTLAQG